ncbi:uncharacterized protein LOC108160051 isoform X2 [Drosophila miranda]|uniref:uncharacterized protein LOC108160051 isoform X2 n=1 Tax=Drosophila miranda TaxID=7229 RepID=UPI0007E62694|nr:uncharacterized protein LOC108160051 isoform X2 [Drosophila miranda]
MLAISMGRKHVSSLCVHCASVAPSGIYYVRLWHQQQNQKQKQKQETCPEHMEPTRTLDLGHIYSQLSKSVNFAARLGPDPCSNGHCLCSTLTGRRYSIQPLLIATCGSNRD